MLGLIADYTVHVGVIGGYDSGRGVCLLFRETFYEKAGHIVFLWNVYSNGFQALGIAHAVAIFIQRDSSSAVSISFSGMNSAIALSNLIFI